MICGCIDNQAVRVMMRDILGMFPNMYGDEPNCYIDLDRAEQVTKKYGEPQVSVILSLLEELKCVQHSGNLLSSSHLTFKGQIFRDKVQGEPDHDNGIFL
jgi:hypothetical protein